MPLPKSFTKVTPFSKYLALSMLIIIPILAFFYGQYYERETSKTQSPDKTIVSIFRHGGLCPTGECKEEFFIYNDGTMTKEGKQIKKLTTQEVADLINIISGTDFNQIKNTPFTGTCPTAYDGQESIYTFYLPNSRETLASCEYNLSGVLFDFLSTTILSVQTQPTPTNVETTSSPQRPRSAEGEFCGGIAAFQCQDGYICQYEGTYPDAGGKCVKKP